MHGFKITPIILLWRRNWVIATRTKKRKNSDGDQDSESITDDEEAVTSHVSELQKEFTKKKQDDNKVARLMSLTHSHRKGDILSKPANIRITATLKAYPCLKKPVFVSWKKILIMWL